MKSRSDLVKGLLRKAQSDLDAAESCLKSKTALDSVCFHAQQAAEKAVKAFLVFSDQDPPRIHNIEKLIDLCGRIDSGFSELRDLAAGLTPYAVELRYDDEFWPSTDTAEEAHTTAVKIVGFVRTRLSGID